MKLAKLIEKMTDDQAAKLCDILTQFRVDQLQKMRLKNVKYEKA